MSQYLSEGSLRSGQDFYYAAFTFHHGSCSDHFDLAHRLAQLSMDLGHEARRMYAATLDRWLLSTGRRQRFGTQYDAKGDCQYVLSPVDRSTTDEERREHDVPALADARAHADVLTQQCRAGA